MDQYHAFLLHEMGITTWQSNASQTAALTPSEPEATPAIAPVDLSTYEIAIIGEPTALNSDFVVAVLKSMQLKPTQAKVLSMSEFLAYQGSMPTWLWSTQGNVAAMPNCRVINSPSIIKTSQDQDAKHALWRQIKSHLAAQRKG